MNDRPQVKSLSHTHEMVMNWLLQNPEKSNRECADFFNYTEAWLSSLIHSDAFQAKFRELKDEVFIAVLQDVPTKLSAAADLAIDKITEDLSKSTDKEYNLDAFDKIMHRAGYAPMSKAQTVNPVQNNFFAVSPGVLAQVREGMNPKPIEVEAVPVLLESPVNGTV